MTSFGTVPSIVTPRGAPLEWPRRPHLRCPIFQTAFRDPSGWGRYVLWALPSHPHPPPCPPKPGPHAWSPHHRTVYSGLSVR